jgi:hypothetical protein
LFQEREKRYKGEQWRREFKYDILRTFVNATTVQHNNFKKKEKKKI